MVKYKHTTQLHNTDSAYEIVPLFLELFKPQSVIDVGCGLGEFIKVFKEKGVSDVLGLNGKWCDKKLLYNNISCKDFMETDLENPINIKRKYDLAICLEVAEHLTEKRAETFISELTGLSDLVVFSAAIPGQGGYKHLNEQWPQYWHKLFQKNGFDVCDCFKSYIWNNPKICWWYKQNMFLAFKINSPARPILPDYVKINDLKNVVHSELFSNYADFRAPHAVKRHLMLLIKSIIYKIRIKPKGII